VSGTRGREIAAACDAVREAAALCRRIGAAVRDGALEKRDRSPVTLADFGSQALICRRLAEAFPDDAIVAEEDSAALREPDRAPLVERLLAELAALGFRWTADELFDAIDRGGAEAAGGRFWTLDPIDGTKGFLRGDQYAIALALIEDGRPVVAVLGCPELALGPDARPGVLAVAEAGGAARALPLDESGGPERRLQVSDVEDPHRARFCEPFEAAHSAHDRAAAVARALGIRREPLRMDSQAKYVAVAAGLAEIYLRIPRSADYREKIWDHAAGALLVERAGGRVTDIAGRPLEFTCGRTLAANAGIVASNGRFHDRIVAALS